MFGTVMRHEPTFRIDMISEYNTVLAPDGVSIKPDASSGKSTSGSSFEALFLFLLLLINLEIFRKIRFMSEMCRKWTFRVVESQSIQRESRSSLRREKGRFTAHSELGHAGTFCFEPMCLASAALSQALEPDWFPQSCCMQSNR